MTIPMKTLTMPNGKTYEIVDDKARKDIASVDTASKRDCVAPIVQTVEGQTIAITDSSNRPIRNLRIFGKTSQFTTSGTNLLENIGQTIAASGITYTVNDNGSVHAKGTATANAYFTINGNFFNGAVPIPDWLVVGETYTVTDATLYLYKSDGTFVSYTNNTVTIPDGYTYYGVFIMVESGTSIDKTYYPRINAGSVSLPFEPYTGGIASPSPSYPQAMESAMNPIIGITGANLFDTSRLPSVSRGGVEITNNGDGSFGISGLGTTTETCSCEYSISHDEMCLLFHPGKLRLITNVKTYPMVFVNLYKNGSFHSTIMSSTWSRDYAFELPDEYFENDIYSLRVGLHANANTTIINGIVKPVLTQFEGDIDEVYKEQQTIDVNRTLNGIGDVCDEIDFERKLYIQRISTMAFDGTRGWALAEQMPESGYHGVLCAAVPDMKEGTPAFCNRYRLGDGVGLIGKDGQFDTYYGQFRVNAGTYTSADQWKTQLAEWNAEGNPLTLVYQLATPIETPLTEEELAVFNTLYTHKTNTSVINNAGIEMEVEYSTDLEKWIKSYITQTSDEVEAEQIMSAISEYFEKNPVSGGNTGTGEDGFSPIVKIEQTDTGAIISITDKNGTTTATINNGERGYQGEPGGDGYTPVRGVDYWTSADKAEMESYIATELAKRGQLQPEHANSIEDCTDTTKLYVLPDGMIYAYMAYENVSAGGEPLFTNLADPTSSDWQADKRFSSSSGSISSCTGTIVSNSITAKKGDIIRVKGLQNGTTSETNNAYVGLMGYSDNPGSTKQFTVPMFFDKTRTQNSGGVKDLITTEDGVVVYPAFKYFDNSDNIIEHANSASVLCIRVSGEPVTTVDDIIVTVNEEIAYSEGSSETGYKWQSTGHAFVPADYESRIVELEQKATNHTSRIVAIEKAVTTGGADETEAAALERIKVWDKPVYDSAPVTLIADNRTKPALTTSDRTIDGIYAKYRALMADYPDYITETNMGKSASSDTFAAVDMLRFDFCEPRGLTQPGFADSERHETKSTLIFLSGIHNEWVGVWGLYYALEEIVTNPDFDDVRRNAHIIVIPCANPYGLVKPLGEYGTPSHVNANGVAIHNNFGVDWVLRGAIGEYNYSGTEPYSEPETQYIDAVMAEYPDAVAFVSCHNNDYSTYYESPVIWASSATYHMCNVAFRLIDKISKAWIEKYGQTLKDSIDEIKINMDANDYRLGRACMSTSAGTEQLNATKYGIQGVNLEISRMMKVFSGDTDGTSEVMTHGAEVYANFMRTLLWNYDHKDKKEYAPNLPWTE